MIDRLPREGHGYGIIRMSFELTAHIAPLAQINLTDVQGELHAQGVFEQVKQGIYLPDDYTIMGIYIEPYRFAWVIVVEAPGIPSVAEGEVLPVLIPIYRHTWATLTNTRQSRLERIELAPDPMHVLRVD